MTLKKNDIAAQPCAPATLDELKALVVLIGQGSADLRLGAKAYDTLARLVDKPEQTAVSSISELAGRCQVNASTLTRLAKKLGYAGFNEFQSLFRSSVTEQEQHFYSQHVERLFGDEGNGDLLENFHKIVVESMKNQNKFLRQLDPQVVREVVRLLAHAPQVRLYAERQLYALTSFLGYGLGLIRDQVVQLESRNGMAGPLSTLGDRDVLVVASCHPYTRNVVETARVVRGRGVKVVAITDYLSSPLAACADYSFYIPHESSYLINSMAAYIVFVEGLINSVAKELGEAAVKILQANELLYQQLNTEL